MPECERCVDGELVEQASGFFMCDRCDATVDPNNLRTDGKNLLNR